VVVYFLAHRVHVTRAPGLLVAAFMYTTAINLLRVIPSFPHV